MALQYKAVMVEDNGPSRTQAQEDERKRKQEQQQAMTADPRANMQMAYSTPTKTATTPAAAKSPYEQRQAEIKAGVNKEQPISYTAPAREEEEEAPVQQKKKSGGVMADFPHHTRSAAELESQWFAPQEEEEEAPAAARPKAANAEPESKAAVPQIVSEATETVISEPRRKGKQKAEEFTRLTYTGGDIAQKNTNVGTASQTKAAITGEEEEEPQWIRDLAEANAEDRRRRQAVANANQELAIRAMNAGPQYDQGSIDAMRNDALQQINRNRQLQEDAQAAAQAASVEQARQWADAYAAARRNGYLPDPQVVTTTQQTGANATPTTVRTEADYGTTPERARALEVAQSMGLFGPEAVEFADRIIGSGMYNFKPNEAQIKTKAESYYLDKMYSDEEWHAMTEAQKNAAKEKAKSYADDVAGNYRVGTPDNQRFDARQGSAITYEAPNRSGEDRAEANAPKPTTNNRPGAAAEVASWDQNQGWIQTNDKEGIVIDEGAKIRPNKNGEAATNALGTAASATSGSSTTSDGKNPKGTQYLTPSYGQGGKVVKLPYKSGGYTEAELMALGNKAYGTKYGANVYEGYYQAPDGNYYPVDQEKAAYYLRNGYSYEGWEEPMRDYYNTFGTFYGYRPDWKQAGKANNNYSYSPRSYSYSAGGGSSRSSYGRGSTPNNGMYWNGLTSWNA